MRLWPNTHTACNTAPNCNRGSSGNGVDAVYIFNSQPLGLVERLPNLKHSGRGCETHGVAKTYYKEAAMEKGSVLLPVVVSRAILQRQQVINFAFVIKELCKIFKSYCSGGGWWYKWNCSREWKDTLTT